MKVFPDATFIVTHRDPVDVSVSMATMMTYTMRMSVDKVDVPTVANYWIGRIDEMLTRASATTTGYPATAPSTYDSTTSWPTIWPWCNGSGRWPDTTRATDRRKAVADYLAGHTRGRLGRIDYRADELGLDKDDLRRRFAPYVERFVNV